MYYIFITYDVICISSSGSHFELSPKYHVIQQISTKDSQIRSVLLSYYCGRACIFSLGTVDVLCAQV